MSDIVLIDDNSRGQRLAYGASFVDEEKFVGVLNHVERLNKDSDLSFMEGAKCVLLHDSLEDWTGEGFDQHSHMAKESIMDFLIDRHIPYVCFSDGHESIGAYDEDKINIERLKKSDFYGRLYTFIEYYISEGEIQFRILAYGKNYLMVQMTMSARALLQKLQSKRPSDIITPADVMPSEQDEPHYLEDLVELAQPAIGMDYDGVLNLIEDEEMTAGEFKKHINNILTTVAQNGKNTYTWK